MPTSSSSKRIIAAAVSSLFVSGALARIASATPYASGITQSAGTVTFNLNESATDVTVLLDGVPTSLGAMSVGSHSFALGGASTFSVAVSNSATTAGYFYATGLTSGIAGIKDGTPNGAVLQISSDANPRNSFNSPRGIAINRNPANGSLFGQVYVSNSTSGSSIAGRFLSDGIYVNGADGSDPLAQGDGALDGGISDFSFNSNAPFRLALDSEGFLYISNPDNTFGTVYRTDAAVASGTNLLVGGGLSGPTQPTDSQNHGSVPALYVEGTAAAGNLKLYTIDEDLSPNGVDQMNSVWQYNIGSTTEGSNVVPTQLAHLLVGTASLGGIVVDLARGPGSGGPASDGKFYLAQRDANGDQTGLFVVGSDGVTPLYDSRADTIARGYDEDSALGGTQDVIRRVRGIDVSPDGQWIAIVRDDSTTMVVPLIDGIPDLPNRRYLATFPQGNNGRDVAFDAADNLYVLSSSSQLMRVFSPGKVSLAITNSDGTFTYHNEPEWFVDASGNSSGTGNWMLGYSPNGIGEIARFGNAITGPQTITLDVPTTLGTIKFDSANKYTIAGSSTLTLSAIGEPRVTVLNGSHDITAPVVAQQNLQLTVIPQAATLTMSNLSLVGGAGGSLTLTKAGAGVAAVNNVRAKALMVTAGTLQVIPGVSPNDANSTSVVKTLTIANGAAVDLTSNSMIIDYTGPVGTLVSDVRGHLRNGRLISSAAGTTTRLGYGDNAVLNKSSFAGQSVDTSSILVKYTYAGDSDLDGDADGVDIGTWATNFTGELGGTGTMVWTQGDWDYDGDVDGVDAGLWAQAFTGELGGQGLGEIVVDDPNIAPGAAAILEGMGITVVPEPASLGLLALGSTMLAARRRRRI
ncbi:MAG TPA: PEP-CTERM sorting domain-containing protein [Tepidisphaeraceae bacterium]|jgi:hypothetical protein